MLIYYFISITISVELEQPQHKSGIIWILRYFCVYTNFEEDIFWRMLKILKFVI